MREIWLKNIFRFVYVMFTALDGCCLTDFTSAFAKNFVCSCTSGTTIKTPTG